MSVYNTNSVRFEVRLKSDFANEKWSIIIGRRAVEKAKDKVGKFLQEPKVARSIKYIFGINVLKAFNQFNAGGAKIPVYSGAYAVSYLNPIIPWSVSSSDLVWRLAPAGCMHRRGENMEISDRIQIMSDVRIESGGGIKIRPRINTGGGLNPNMALIYSLQFFTGGIHPYYRSNVEETGWKNCKPYDARAWDKLFEIGRKKTMPHIKKLLEVAAQ